MAEPTELGPIGEGFGRRYGQASRALLSLGSDLFATFPLGDADMDMETRVLTGSRRCSVGLFDGAGGAGNYSTVGVQNPAASGVLAVVEAIMVQSSIGQDYSLRLSTVVTAGPDSVAAGVQLDSRLAFSPSSLNGFTITAAATIGSNIQSLSCPAVDVRLFPIGSGIVLAPGSQLNVNGNPNEAVSASFVWRERRIGTWERSA